jgi:hypothetical protein
MTLAGAVAISPYADMSALVDAAEQGTLAGTDQFRTYLGVLQSVANSDPEFDLDLYRSPSARDNWGLIADCAPVDPDQARKLLSELKPDDLRPRDAGAAADLRARLSRVGVPAPYPTPGSAPVFVAYGTLDATAPAGGIERAISDACAKGQQIEVLRRVGGTEAGDDQVIDAAMGWLLRRFDGEKLANSCLGAP